ncbi:MAG: IS1182 family transposase [Planctomycetes bacterium]|nr:IS1182 family transposase [Planctomycetota bacterium]
MDRQTPLLLPPDLRDWVPEDDMVHFVIRAVEGLPREAFKINHRGTGSEQYPPGMMLALLIYCYANGTFSSRRIERATYRDVAVRYLTGNTHPDHSTICAFRSSNEEAIAEAFLHVLKLAREMGVLKVGTISVDGSLVDANASRYKNVSYERAQELEEKLQEDIEELLRKAEKADKEGEDDGQKLPEHISRRQKLLGKMREAQRELEEKARRRAERQQEAYQEKLRAREERPSSRKGPIPKPPKETPEPDDQVNLTDPDSNIMRKNRRKEYRQSYNGQAAVDADGSQMVLATGVSSSSSDRGQLVPTVEEVSENLEKPEAVLADTGYCNVAALKQLQEEEIEPYVSVGAEENHTERAYEFRPQKKGRKKKNITDPVLLDMKEKLESEAGRRMYAKRKMTVEPVFGIIKHVMGFRQFLLRGLEKVRSEWRLVCLAYNVKRLFRLAEG